MTTHLLADYPHQAYAKIGALTTAGEDHLPAFAGEAG